MIQTRKRTWKLLRTVLLLLFTTMFLGGCVGKSVQYIKLGPRPAGSSFIRLTRSKSIVGGANKFHVFDVGPVYGENGQILEQKNIMAPRIGEVLFWGKKPGGKKEIYNYNDIFGQYAIGKRVYALTDQELDSVRSELLTKENISILTHCYRSPNPLVKNQTGAIDDEDSFRGLFPIQKGKGIYIGKLDMGGELVWHRKSGHMQLLIVNYIANIDNLYTGKGKNYHYMIDLSANPSFFSVENTTPTK